MPKAFPPEFRDEVVRVARRREQPLRQTAKDFGISESCLNRWLAIDDIESGDRRDGRAWGRRHDLVSRACCIPSAIRVLTWSYS